MVGERVLKEVLKEGGHGEGPRPAWLATFVRTGEDTGARGWGCGVSPPAPAAPAAGHGTVHGLGSVDGQFGSSAAGAPGRGTRFLPPLCVPPDASPFSSGRRSEQVFTRAPLLRLSPNSVASWVRGGYDSNIQISGERMSAHSTAPVNYGSPRPSRTRERDGLGAETADRAGATPRGKLPRAPADLQTRRPRPAFHPGPCPRRRPQGAVAGASGAVPSGAAGPGLTSSLV